MQKRLELAKEFSCLNRAESKEPIFVIRAKDELGAQTVRLWAAMADGVHEPEKINEALECAVEMEKWRSDNLSKVAMPSPIYEDHLQSPRRGPGLGRQ